jgi:hypothetical protein
MNTTTGIEKRVDRTTTRRRALRLLAVAIPALLATLAVAQDDGWSIVRADYGWRNQRNNVTDLVRDLVARGGVNGRVSVNNQTMGGDPAVGKDKTLHIVAQNRRGEQREFEFREDAAIDVGMFVARGDRDDRPRYGDRDGDRDRDSDRDRGDWNDLRIASAYYGVQGQTVNVTEIVRRLVREGRGEVRVSNQSFGADPAPGRDKVLIVVYTFRGVDTACAVSEGNLLHLP